MIPRDLERRLLDSGFRMRQTKRSHVVIYGPTGQRVATVSGSGSDWRASKNLMADLYRAGLKKESGKG